VNDLDHPADLPARGGGSVHPTPTVRLIANTDHEIPTTALNLRSLREAGEVARVLATRTAVIVDLGRLGPGARRRALDVLSGIAYALDASMTRRGRSRYLLTPQVRDS
jgi:FtsZ-interacting cell division protein YlmF